MRRETKKEVGRQREEKQEGEKKDQDVGDDKFVLRRFIFVIFY
jgi:hypothetical protein